MPASVYVDGLPTTRPTDPEELWPGGAPTHRRCPGRSSFRFEHCRFRADVFDDIGGRATDGEPYVRKILFAQDRNPAGFVMRATCSTLRTISRPVEKKIGPTNFPRRIHSKQLSAAGLSARPRAGVPGFDELYTLPVPHSATRHLPDQNMSVEICRPAGFRRQLSLPCSVPLPPPVLPSTTDPREHRHCRQERLLLCNPGSQHGWNSRAVPEVAIPVERR